MSQPENVRAEFAWNAHSYVNEYIRFADTKAQLVIGWVSAMVAALAAAGYNRHFSWTFVGVISVTGISLLLCAFIFAFLTVFPRLSTERPRGFLFWRSISHFRCKEDFVAQVKTCTTEKLNDELYGHLFEVSRVCDAKYWWVRLSIAFAFVGSLVSGVAFLMQNWQLDSCG